MRALKRTMPIGTLAICLALSLVASTGKVRAQSLDFYENAVRSVTVAFKNAFCPELPSAERSECEETPIVVKRSWGFVGRASASRIEISAGTGWIFDTIDWARTFSNEITGSDDCFNEYMSYVYEGIDENTQRLRAGMSAKRVDGIGLFAPGHASCDGINAETIAAVGASQASIHARGVESSLIFILLHELGHVVLGHTKHDPDSLSLAVKRDLETDADTWAVETANRSSYMLGSSMAPYFIASLQQSTTDWEQNSDHPMGMRRLANFYGLILNDLESNPGRREQLGGDYEAVLNDTREQAELANGCLAKIESGSNCF